MQNANYNIGCKFRDGLSGWRNGGRTRQRPCKRGMWQRAESRVGE